MRSNPECTEVRNMFNHVPTSLLSKTLVKSRSYLIIRNRNTTKRVKGSMHWTPNTWWKGIASRHSHSSNDRYHTCLSALNQSSWKLFHSTISYLCHWFNHMQSFNGCLHITTHCDCFSFGAVHMHTLSVGWYLVRCLNCEWQTTNHLWWYDSIGRVKKTNRRAVL